MINDFLLDEDTNNKLFKIVIKKYNFVDRLHN